MNIPGLLAALQAAGQFKSIDAGKLNVGQHEFGMEVSQQLQRFFRARRSQDVIPLINQKNPRELQVDRRIVDNQNGFARHGIRILT